VKTTNILHIGPKLSYPLLTLLLLLRKALNRFLYIRFSCWWYWNRAAKAANVI